MSHDHEHEHEDSPREDPTLAAPAADATESIPQSTPPTQSLPQWQPPYPATHGDTPPPPPPVAYPYAGAEPTPIHPPQQAAPPYNQPPAQPYGQQPAESGHAPAAYGQPAHGQPAYGPPPPSALPQYSVPGVAYGPPPQTNASALVLTIISGILTVSCYFTLVGIPSLIIGIIALTKQNTDIEGSRRLSRIGWITFAIVGVLYVLMIAGFITAAVLSDSGSSSDYEY
jgi:hypothetical protein